MGVCDVFAFVCVWEKEREIVGQQNTLSHPMPYIVQYYTHIHTPNCLLDFKEKKSALLTWTIVRRTLTIRYYEESRVIIVLTIDTTLTAHVVQSEQMSLNFLGQMGKRNRNAFSGALITWFNHLAFLLSSRIVEFCVWQCKKKKYCVCMCMRLRLLCLRNCRVCEVIFVKKIGSCAHIIATHTTSMKSSKTHKILIAFLFLIEKLFHFF